METASRVLLTFLLNAAWQIVAILAVAFLCSLGLRRTAAKYQYPLWVAALVLCVLLPAWSLRQAALARPASASAPAGSNMQFRIAASGSAQHDPTPFAIPRLAPVPIPPAMGWAVTVLYSVFLAYRIGRIGFAWRHTHRLRALPVHSDTGGRLQSLADRCCFAFGLKHTLPVSITESAGPVALGAFRPVLLVPAALAEAASEAELMSALGHELAHVRRQDYAVNLACELICLPVSFHPALLLIKSRIEQTRELACDDLAAASVASRAVYARSLLSMAASLCTTSCAPNYYGYYMAVVLAPEVAPAGANIIDVTLHITAGAQYRLREIRFQGAKAFTVEQLRPLFPLQPGEVLRVSAIRTGLDALRRLYVAAGYRDITPIPNSMIDEADRTVELTIDIHEGAESHPAPPL